MTGELCEECGELLNFEYECEHCCNSVASACSLVTWDENKPNWFIAVKNGKPVSAFRFESAELNGKRSYCDQQKNPVGMWLAWVPGTCGSRLLQWPEETSIEKMKADLIREDHRLQ